METLVIVIKSEWFDQIASKEKTIEYRDVTSFWTSRLFDKEGSFNLSDCYNLTEVQGKFGIS